MRVIAGAFKGRRLESPRWPGLRPTSDRLRETLFNILAPRVEGARVLDGYAGTGAVGIEALSRGAVHVTFVEQDSRARRLIAANLRKCGVPEQHAMIRPGFSGVLRSGDRFEVVFVDPPYGADSLEAALEAGAPFVSSHGLLILEHATRDIAPDAAGSLVRTRQVVQGDSTLSFYGPTG